VRERHLFRLAYGVLALAFWVSVAGFTYLMTRPEHDKKIVWSAWKPARNDLSGAREIAQHLAPLYRLDDGKQLAAIQEHPPEIGGTALEAIGIRKSTTGGPDKYAAVYGGNRTLLYAFCGVGDHCSVPGETSAARELLLRREALELALYSFRYIKGIDGVVALLPPSAGTSATAPTQAVYLRKSAIGELLDRPLRSILPRSEPPAPSELDTAEANVVDLLTARRTYPAQFEPLPDGDGILVLQAETS
jgi:hypothetical protein